MLMFGNLFKSVKFDSDKFRERSGFDEYLQCTLTKELPDVKIPGELKAYLNQTFAKRGAGADFTPGDGKALLATVAEHAEALAPIYGSIDESQAKSDIEELI